MKSSVKKPVLNIDELPPEIREIVKDLSPKEQTAFVLQCVEETKRRKEQEQMREFLPCNDGQRAIWEALKDHSLALLVIRGGNQSGKSFLTIMAGALALRNEGPLAGRWGDSPITIRQCSPDFEVGVDTVLLPTWKQIIRRDMLAGHSWAKAYSIGKHILDMEREGSFVQWMSYHQDSRLHQAATRHMIIMDEWPTRAIYNESKMRLVRHNGIMIIAATPTAGTAESWQLQLIKDIEAGIIPNAKTVQLHTEDNIYLSKDALKAQTHGFTEDELRMRLHGDFVPKGGAVLPRLNHSVHLIDGFIPPDSAPTNVALDVHDNKDNYGNFAAILTKEICENPNNWENGEIKWEVPRNVQELHIWQEFTSGDVIAKTCETLGLAAGLRKIDNFMIERSVKNYNSNTATNEFRDFKTHYPFKKWLHDAVGGRVILDELSRVDEVTRRTQIYIHRTCEITWDQMVNWSYKDPALRGEQRPEEVRKVYDDMCDCARAHGQWMKSHSLTRQQSFRMSQNKRSRVIRDPITNGIIGTEYVEVGYGS